MKTTSSLIRWFQFASTILATSFLMGCASMPVETQTWDKTFAKSEKVIHEKVFYPNRYGITVAADLYLPKSIDKLKTYPAILVSTPYGGVKEQGAGIYAQTMAERGFVAMAFDESYNGESGGSPRHVSSPDIFVEDFSAGVDYLGIRPFVDRNRIGVIGICGSGGFAITAAQVDHRIKAVATASMYDMSRVTRNGWKDSRTDEQRQHSLDQLAQQRWKDVDNGSPWLPPGFPNETADSIPEGLDPISREFWEYYAMERGHHRRSHGPFTKTSEMAFMNFSLMNYIATISPRPILFIMGENAHSLITIDPRRTKEAEKADLWLQIRPGTDVAMMLGWIRLIIEEGLYDHDFVANWTIGFEDLKEAVSSYTPEDYVFPASSTVEQPELWLTSGFCLACTQGMALLYERRNSYDFYRGLGLSLGQEEYWPWETVEQVYDYCLEPVGLTFSQLSDQYGIFGEREFRRYEKFGFGTPSGKVELRSSVFEDLGLSPLPVYREPVCGPSDSPLPSDDYPFILITGSRFMPMYHSEQRQIEKARKKNPDPMVTLHPETAAKLNLEPGDWAVISTPMGKIRQRVQLSDTIRQDIVDAQHGWWFPERTQKLPDLFGVFESNANLLCPDDPEFCSPEIGSWPHSALLCNIEKETLD